MSAFLFWTSALLMLVFGAAVIINRNPVASALSLVVSFLALATLFISLNAYFCVIFLLFVFPRLLVVFFFYILCVLVWRGKKLKNFICSPPAGGLGVALVFIIKFFPVGGKLSIANKFSPPLARSTSDDV